MSSSKKKIPKKYAPVVLRINASHTVTIKFANGFFKPITEDSENKSVKARREKTRSVKVSREKMHSVKVSRKKTRSVEVRRTKTRSKKASRARKRAIHK
jgi:hypothetical protein